MAKDFARGERMMARPTPIKVDRANDMSQQGSSNTPSWQNRSYGYTALESDTIPPIPEHFKTGSWTNRFGNQSAQTEQVTSTANLKQPVLVANAATMGMGEFVMKQIAKRSPGLAAKAAGLSLADGPVPIGELLAIGLTAATAYEIYQEWQKYQQVMQSTHDHGGGKNSQHGKSEDRPSDLRRLAELQEQLKNAQGKEKKAIQIKINRLREEMAKRRKGENHSQKPKK
jgi:hypothetical protein